MNPRLYATAYLNIAADHMDPLQPQYDIAPRHKVEEA